MRGLKPIWIASVLLSLGALGHADWRALDPLPAFDARKPQREGDFLALNSKTGRAYYVPLKLKAKLLRDEVLWRGTRQFRKLVFELVPLTRPPAGRAPVNVDMPEIELGHGAWRLTDQVQWVLVALNGGEEYRLEVEGRAAALDDFFAKFNAGTFQPYFKDRLLFKTLVAETVELEADLNVVKRLKDSGYSCKAGYPLYYDERSRQLMFKAPEECYFRNMNPIDPRVLKGAIRVKDLGYESFTLVQYDNHGTPPVLEPTANVVALTALAMALYYPDNYRKPQTYEMPAYVSFGIDVVFDGGKP